MSEAESDSGKVEKLTNLLREQIGLRTKDRSKFEQIFDKEKLIGRNLASRTTTVQINPF